MKIVSKQSLPSLVGTESEPTDWLELDQDRIDCFADCTLDHQFIHVDKERAAKTPFGSTIAHGFLSLSMLSYFSEQFSFQIEGVQMGVNYGFDKVRFLAPVKSGKRVRARAKFLDITETKPKQYRITSEVTVDIEGEDKPALIAEWLVVQITD